MHNAHKYNMAEVKSSAISHIGHHDGKLRVTYKNGGTYEYDDVSADQHGAIIGSESVGKYLAGLKLKGRKI